MWYATEVVFLFVQVFVAARVSVLEALLYLPASKTIEYLAGKIFHFVVVHLVLGVPNGFLLQTSFLWGRIEKYLGLQHS